MSKEDLLSAARRACRFFNIDNTSGGGLISVETQHAMNTLDIEWRKENDRRKRQDGDCSSKNNSIRDE